MRRSLESFFAFTSLLLPSCATHPEGGAPTPATTPVPAAPSPAEDTAFAACTARERAVEALPSFEGAPSFDRRRAEFLGRARGEPMIFVREPRATPDQDLSRAWLASRRLFEKAPPGIGRVASLRLRHKHEPEALRALLLREGYAYAPDPLDALGLVTEVALVDLFAEPEIWIQRGSDARRLARVTRNKEVAYRYVDGPAAGRAADLLFGDRVAKSAAELATPLHRDLRALADEVGFDRARLRRRTDDALLVDLRFGDRWVPAVLEAHGSKLDLGCVDADRETREAVSAYRSANDPKRRAIVALHGVVGDELVEALRFDRPEGEKTAEHDGELRPVWYGAYLQNRDRFEYQGASYPVFDPSGKPWPPEVCVDFVLDSFERASGTWFAPRGDKLGRVRGRLDFDDAKIKNRRGVLAFGAFAEATPELFESRRFAGAERIPFKDRTAFFQFLVDHADEVKPGDVVAIHGMKADHHIHQHAILVEWADPLTGFPFGLADQMKRPRRRTWEGIMAEAPLRSLLYRARPKDSVFAKLDPEG